MTRSLRGLAATLALAVTCTAAADGDISLDLLPTPPQTEEVGDRLEPLVELGNDFLGQGTLGDGIELPTGAVWRPSLLVFGTLRSALQTWDDSRRTSSC